MLNNGDKYEGTIVIKPKVFGVDTLIKGDEGEAVKLMQQYLHDLGYDLGSYGIDGDFGKDTVVALKAFQKDNGLAVTGSFDLESYNVMIEKIEESMAEPENPDAPMEPETPVEPEVPEEPVEPAPEDPVEPEHPVEPEAPTAPESSVKPEKPAGDLVVSTGSWRVRTGPGTAYSTAGYVHGGDVIHSVAIDGWVPVLYKGEVHFISEKALKKG